MIASRSAAMIEFLDVGVFVRRKSKANEGEKKIGYEREIFLTRTEIKLIYPPTILTRLWIVATLLFGCPELKI